jgi:hypothetical protein
MSRVLVTDDSGAGLLMGMCDISKGIQMCCKSTDWNQERSNSSIYIKWIGGRKKQELAKKAEHRETANMLV